MRVQCPRCPKIFDVVPRMDSVRINSDTVTFGFADFVVLHQCNETVPEPIPVPRVKWCRTCERGQVGGQSSCDVCDGPMVTLYRTGD